MANAATKNKISISREEYLRLRKLDKQFRGFFSYLENLMDIRESREQVKQKKIISQEKLFRHLGL